MPLAMRALKSNVNVPLQSLPAPEPPELCVGVRTVGELLLGLVRAFRQPVEQAAPGRADHLGPRVMNVCVDETGRDQA